MCRSIRALTVLELLLGIVVIAILASLLSSVVLTYRKTAESARCVNNLRQIGIALQMYTADFNGKILPRYADDVPAKEPKGWPSRLIARQYLDNVDGLLCPSFFPRNAKEATKTPGQMDASQAYGMRSWEPVGGRWGDTTSFHKPMVAIKDPARFFIVADSIWLNWNSQGYGITPGSANQGVHLRHRGEANTLFADGHVEAKSAAYFEEISQSQTEYTGAKVLKFVLVSDPDPAKAE